MKYISKYQKSVDTLIFKETDIHFKYYVGNSNTYDSLFQHALKVIHLTTFAMHCAKPHKNECKKRPAVSE